MQHTIEPPIPTGFGWRPDPPDQRDFLARSILPPLKAQDRPDRVDLRDEMPPVFDQGRIGSCVSQSLAALVYQARRKHEWNVAHPSRPFIYYQSRILEGTVLIDPGQYIRTAAKVLAHHGAPPERYWPHELDPNDIPDPQTWEFPKTSRWRRQPTTRVTDEASRWQALAYYRVSTLDEMLNCLAAGFAFVIGYTVYSSFYGRDGWPVIDVPLPAGNESALGGHAVVIVGYEQSTARFLCRNSWGTDVQDKGHFTMRFDHLTNARLAGDAWTIREVERHGSRD